MHLPQLLKLFNIDIRQLRETLAKRIQVPDLRMVREVPVEWEAILLEEIGPPATPRPMFATVKEALAAADASVVVSVAGTLDGTTGSRTSEPKVLTSTDQQEGKIKGAIELPAPQKRNRYLSDDLDKSSRAGGRLLSLNPPPRKSTFPSSSSVVPAKRPISRPSSEAVMCIGQVTNVVIDKGFGFVKKFDSGESIFWNIKQINGYVAGTMPEENAWLILAEQPSTRHLGKQEVSWAQPLQADLPLLARLLQAAAPDLLLALIKSQLTEEVKNVTVTELLARLQPITDEATLHSGVRLLEVILQNAPEHSSEAISASMAAASPAYEWQLWMRYLSALRDWPTEAKRVIGLLQPLPAVVQSWWPSVSETGIEALYQTYIHQSLPEEKLNAWQQLKTALGNKLQATFDSLIGQWVEQLTAIDSLAQLRQCQQIVALTWGDQTPTLHQLYLHLDEVLQLEVWLMGERDLAFPRKLALSRFAVLAPGDQKKVAAQLSDSEFMSVALQLTEASPESLRQRARKLTLPLLADTMAAFALDLESDRETIQEVAWGNPGTWQVGRRVEEVAATLASLAIHVTTAGQLAVGHNIRDFDAPVLADHGVLLSAENLWDTMLVEMALSPELQVFALKTKHTAAADAEVAWHLFLNQIQRLLLVTASEWDVLRPLFASSVADKLSMLRDRFSGTTLLSATLSELALERLEWFRPQPVPSGLLLEMRAALAATDLPPVRLILAPLLAWGEAGRVPGLRFWVDESTSLEYRELNEAAVSQQLVNQPTEAVWVIRFFDWCRSQDIVPTATAMAAVMRVRLRQYLVLAECLAPVLPFDGERPGCVCLTPDQLRVAQVPSGGWPGVGVLVVNPGLLSLSGKKLLRDNLGIQDLLAAGSATRSEWLKFSGGQSFVGLTRELALELRAEIPPGLEYFWLEKRRYGSFRVWGGFRWEASLARIRPSVTRTVGEQPQAFPAGQLRSITIDAARLEQRLGITPFHPESIYRARYWLLQAELVDSISRSQSAPLVLLLTRPEEVAAVGQYFTKRGYFVPATEAALARQLELLHDSVKPRRILVASVTKGAALLRANYRGPVELLLDGFALAENYFLAQGSSLFEQARLASGGQVDAGTIGQYTEGVDNNQSDDTDSTSDDQDSAPDRVEPISREYLLRDTQFLLQLHYPLVNRWQALSLGNHVDNRVWLLDPRLSQLPGLVSRWGLQPLVLDSPWSTQEHYQGAAAQAEEVFGGGQPDTAFQLDLPEAKELLQQVFLQIWDEKQRQLVQHSWKPEQVPYLDRILPAPANLSLLVSLPTGGGKSLLFQAPSLYRSAYTNRLSIVVTPLKALMQDQVEALWERGFHSSVEFLNQDKQDELQQIYSRLAGGEIMLLFITPERFRSRRFARAFEQRLAADGGLEYAVFDEAHCISQWGHEFRPDYLHAARMVQGYRTTSPHKFPVLLFSATVTQKIYEGFTHLFG